MRNILIAIWGLLQGAAGVYWNLLGIAFVFPDSEPGSKEWPEDQMFIPAGIIMIVIWIAIIVVSYVKLRKNKSDIIAFTIPLIIGAAISAFLVSNETPGLWMFFK